VCRCEATHRARRIHLRCARASSWDSRSAVNPRGVLHGPAASRGRGCRSPSRAPSTAFTLSVTGQAPASRRGFPACQPGNHPVPNGVPGRQRSTDVVNQDVARPGLSGNAARRPRAIERGAPGSSATATTNGRISHGPQGFRGTAPSSGAADGPPRPRRALPARRAPTAASPANGSKTAAVVVHETSPAPARSPQRPPPSAGKRSR